ncbi:uncharacterized protein LOC115891268 [Sitophilus oryzae]|uniref:Uncharacterized protein LOC115891268 n=1 Tax=Sitophilus oryzae TaxID=7048 RepID=A0A6J2YTY4_SITOR|nr:uncharacterized protein LOC115891268 [Sitophilus oryzae]
MKSSSSSNNCGTSVLIMILSVLVVFEIASTFAAAYPASYSGYYSPIGFEEQNPNYINLQQAIARLRQAFIENNDLENENNVEQAVSDLVELTKAALENWFYYYEQDLKYLINNYDFNSKNLLHFSDLIPDRHVIKSEEKRSGIFNDKRSLRNKLAMDRNIKRKADFGSERGTTGVQAQQLRQFFHIG